MFLFKMMSNVALHMLSHFGKPLKGNSKAILGPGGRGQDPGRGSFGRPWGPLKGLEALVHVMEASDLDCLGK